MCKGVQTHTGSIIEGSSQGVTCFTGLHHLASQSGVPGTATPAFPLTLALVWWLDTLAPEWDVQVSGDTFKTSSPYSRYR